MAEPVIQHFDTAALFAAIDEARTERKLSWKAVADEIWDLSYELNQQRNDHPISPQTLTGMGKKHQATCQHVLFFLRWLGRTPESFLANPPPADPRFELPTVGPDRRLRWHLKRLYAALNEKRGKEGLTWAQLAVLLECTPSQLTGLRTAKFATGIDLAMRIVQWLERPAVAFIYRSTW